MQQSIVIRAFDHRMSTLCEETKIVQDEPDLNAIAKTVQDTYPEWEHITILVSKVV